MAIQTQHPYIDQEGNEHENLIKTYSDEGLQIIQLSTGNIYDDAVDIYPTNQEYIELIPEDETEGEEQETETNENE